MGAKICSVNQFLSAGPILDQRISSFTNNRTEQGFWTTFDEDEIISIPLPPPNFNYICVSTNDISTPGWSPALMRFTPASTAYVNTGSSTRVGRTSVTYYCGTIPIAYACCQSSLFWSNTIKCFRSHFFATSFSFSLLRKGWRGISI